MRNAWMPPNAPPDDEISVLIRLDDAAEYGPVQVGYHEDGMWWIEDERCTSLVVGWMHLEDAAQILDGACTCGKSTLSEN